MSGQEYNITPQNVGRLANILGIDIGELQQALSYRKSLLDNSDFDPEMMALSTVFFDTLRDKLGDKYLVQLLTLIIDTLNSENYAAKESHGSSLGINKLLYFQILRRFLCLKKDVLKSPEKRKKIAEEIVLDVRSNQGNYQMSHDEIQRRLLLIQMEKIKGNRAP